MEEKKELDVLRTSTGELVDQMLASGLEPFRVLQILATPVARRVLESMLSNPTTTSSPYVASKSLSWVRAEGGRLEMRLFAFPPGKAKERENLI